jgi:hypothetical protein
MCSQSMQGQVTRCALQTVLVVIETGPDAALQQATGKSRLQAVALDSCLHEVHCLGRVTRHTRQVVFVPMFVVIDYVLSADQ